MENITREKAKLYSPLTLAYYGDVVYEMLARHRALMAGNKPVRLLHNEVVSHVRASFQAAAFDRIERILSEEETDIYRRGRNAHSHVPRSSNPAEYRKATGLETLFGYLFLIGETERARELFEVIYEERV